MKLALIFLLQSHYVTDQLIELGEGKYVIWMYLAIN